MGGNISFSKGGINAEGFRGSIHLVENERAVYLFRTLGGIEADTKECGKDEEASLEMCPVVV